MEIDVFISHHTKSSLNIVKAIANRLESRGIRCWYAPRDTEGVYADNIFQAIKSCRVFLLILNKHASESFDVISEINCGVQRLRDGEDMVLLPFHTADASEELSGQVRYYLSSLHWIDAMTPPIFERIDELVSKIEVILGHFAGPKGEPSVPETEFSLVSRLPQPRDIFVGREEQLARLDEEFSRGKNVVFLEGIGGIGKSEIAKQFAVRHHDEFRTVCFLEYKGSLERLVSDPMELQVAGFPEKKPEESEREYFLKKLAVLHQLASRDTLFILDNFDVDDDPDLKEFLSGQARVIVTTRNAHPGYSSVCVDAIRDEDQLLEIFSQNYGERPSDDELETIREIFSMISYHTYAVELIAKQMEASFLTPEEMLEQLKEGALSSGSWEEIEGRGTTGSAFRHICSVFNISHLQEDEKQLLRYLSFMGVGGIGVQWLKDWGQLKNFDTLTRLVRKSWVRRSRDRKVSLHPLIRDVVWHLLKPDYENCSEFLERMALRFYRAWGKPFKENMELLAPCLAMMESFEQVPGKSAKIFSPAVNFLWQLGRFDDSIRYALLVYADNVKSFGAKTHESGYLAQTVAAAYFNSRRLDESYPWYRKSVEDLEVGAPETGDLATAYLKLARCYTYDSMQDFDKAEKLFLQALAIWDRLIDRYKDGEPVKLNIFPSIHGGCGEAERSRGVVFMEMGKMYQAAGNYVKALEMVDAFAGDLEEKGETESNNYTYAYENRGKAYLGLAGECDDPEKRGQYLALALEMMSKALERNLRMRGEVAMDSIDCQEYLGDIYAELGDLGEAANAYMAAAEMLKRLFGEDYGRLAVIREKMRFGQ